MPTGSPIVLVNRTTRPLSFVADGKHFELSPGDNYGFVEGHARLAMAQNPLMGTEDYYSLEYESLVGVKGQTDCSEIDDATLQTANELEAERFNRDRSGIRAGAKVKPRHPMPKGRAVASIANENAIASGR